MRPKRAMSSFDLRAEVAEMAGLEGARFQKAFEPVPGAFLLRLHLAGEGRANVLAQAGRFVLVTARDVPTPSSPGHFPALLRKHLDNAPLASVTQKGFDRVVTFTFGRDPGIDLVVELFGKGNAALVREGRILGVHHSETWKDRTLKGGADYSYPAARVDPTSLDLAGFRASFGGGLDVVRALALGTNLGGTYAEEVCARAGIEKGRQPASLAEGEVELLFDTLSDIVSGLSSPMPNVVKEGGVAVDVAPIELRVHDGLERVAFGTFNEALDHFFDIETPREVSTEAVRRDHRARISARQRESLAAFRKEADDLQAIGDLVYEHYLHFDSTIALVKGSLGGGGEWRAPGGSLPAHVRLLEEFGAIEVRVPDTDRWVRMEITGDVNWNVARMYDRAKRLRAKADGAERAIAEVASRRDLAPGPAAPRRRYTRDFWYEKFKWTLTSGGRLLLAGRDARTNEELVRRHLKDGDIYVHADIHGAPSCVLKGGSSATAGEVREACAFAAIHSKAWSAGLGSVPSYWVLPDQVSRTPESGEYLPKGGFIVRGKRNYEHDIAMRCAVGVIAVEGKPKVVAASREGVEPLTERFVVIEPGDTSRERCVQIADFLGSSADEVARALPGPFRIVSREG